MTRYFQRVGQPGRIEHVEDHWPASIAAMEADPAWREVTVSPVVSGDVIEEVADFLGSLPESRNVFDCTDEATTVIDAGVEYIVRALAARGLLVGEDPEPGMLHRRFDGGRGTVLDDTGRVVGYLAEPRTVTAEEVESALWAWIESVTEGVTRETVSPRVLDRNRPRVLAVIRALGLTVEGDDQ